MNRMLIAAPLMALLLTACVVRPANHGPGMVVVPALPHVVEFGLEPYYYYSGYHYHYDNGYWRYSHSRSGPWIDLPRSHYPKEIKYKNRDHDRGRGDDHDRGRGRDHDKGKGSDHDRGRDGDRGRGRDSDHDRGKDSDRDRGRGSDDDRGRGSDNDRGRRY